MRLSFTGLVVNGIGRERFEYRGAVQSEGGEGGARKEGGLARAMGKRDQGGEEVKPIG